ncbi:Uncharacterized protein APZ42_013818 [Daphnia magna]|uniref:Uncharacterized protein n=1 Tax=Daphnia magna TaxID=35525 RepID=A0A162QFS3_9CRUS|nr:Uncharacterized protein APZ42_013818 [Daphnia magna]
MATSTLSKKSVKVRTGHPKQMHDSLGLQQFSISNIKKIQGCETQIIHNSSTH